MSHIPVVSKNPMNLATGTHCGACNEEWPCEVIRLRKKVDAALALHNRGMNPQNQLYCMECRRIGWPCPTVKALRGEE